VGVYCTQVLSGIYLINYGTYFFELAGLPTSQAFGTWNRAFPISLYIVTDSRDADMGVGFLGKFPLTAGI
jgi:hypothetical protein